jgi:hypothetical protein
MNMRKPIPHIPSRSKVKALQQSQIEMLACLSGLAFIGAAWFAVKLLLQI